MSVPAPNPDLLWRQYKLHVDLYKLYLELTLKFNIFYYAVTGAFLSFYLSRTSVNVLKYSLAFPFLMSVGSAILFLYGARLNRVTRDDIIRLGQLLGAEVWPEVRVLRLSALFCFLVALGLAALFFWSDLIFKEARFR